MTQDQVKGQKIAVPDVAIARQRINCQDVEGVVEKDKMAIVIGNACPACLGKVLLDFTMGRRLAMILRLADGKGKPPVSPLNYGIQP